MKYKKIDNETKNLIEKYNGKIVKEDVHLLVNEIDWSSRANQTRDGDLDKGHIASLQLDISSRGLRNKPLVEFNETSGLYRIISGHHRGNAIKNLIDDKTIDTDRVPCVSVHFSNDIDRELFMQSENHHFPTKSHTRKDAIRFIKNMRQLGYFESAEGDLKILERKVETLLKSHYSRLNSSRRKEVFHESFKDKEITRVQTVLKNELRKQAESMHKSLKSFSWEKHKYLCWGDTNSARKAIAVSLEKRVKMIDEDKVKTTDPRGKIVVVTHFDAKDRETLIEQRKQFLHTETLMNRFAYIPGNLVLISEVCFIPQLDGKSGIKEKRPLKYKWDHDTESFKKS